MNFNDALREVLDEARQAGEEAPPGAHRATPAEMEAILQHGNAMQEAQHEALSEAQLVVARWTWERCGRHVGQHLEEWEAGFLFDWNPSRELVLWVRIALACEKFRSWHPSADATAVVETLVALSCGQRPDRVAGKRLGRKRLQELQDLWEGDYPVGEEN
jgi:hypothetical protein